jgi:hypothetical protein
MTAQRCDPLTYPEIAVPGAKAIAVEEIGDQRIRANPCEHAHGIECGRGRLRAVLAAPTSRYAHLGMQSSLPVDYQHDLARGGVDVHDNLVDQRPHDTLTQTNIGIHALPKLLESLGKR